MKYILWGTGNYAKVIWDEIKEYVICIIDNDKNKWNKEWNGYIINPPFILKNKDLKFDKIIIASADWKVIRDDILNKYGINNNVIDNIFFIKRGLLLNKYKNITMNDEERNCIEYVQQYPLEVFNYEFSNDYVDYSDVDIKYDEQRDLFYVYHYGKKIYFKRTFRDIKSCAKYYKFLLMEQDENSPHKYITEKFNVKKGNIVLDAGVAEGNFALEVIDFVDKIYLIEADEQWIEALQYTFEDYMDKVEIIHGFLGNGNDGTLTVDEIIKNEKIDLIKMDVEGSEYNSLKGARETLHRQHPKMLICT